MSAFEGSTMSLSPLIPNPLPGHSMPIREMYDLVNKQDASWGISGYKVPQEYLDSRELKSIREGNPKKNAPKPTKKGDYLSETIKATKNLPAPNHYNVVKPWVDESKKKSAPKVGNRTTFLDAITLEGKRRPVPGPGQYDVLKTPKVKSAPNKKGSERDNFLMDCEYVSNTIPGPGNYNPRQIQPKVKEARLKPEDWIKKHKDETSKGKKSNLPDVGTYTPSPATFDTFDKLLEKQKSGKGAGKKHWGTEARLSTDKKGKKIDGVPGPGQYNMIASWATPTKGASADKKDGTHVFSHITKGISKSIYYS